MIKIGTGTHQNVEKTIALLSQTIHIESNQSVNFKTQLGQMYGPNTRCKVFFKVSRTPEDNLFNSIDFRKPDLVHPWWCLALNFIFLTWRQTARAIEGIISPSESKGCTSISSLREAVLYQIGCFCYTLCKGGGGGGSDPCVKHFLV